VKSLKSGGSEWVIEGGTPGAKYETKPATELKHIGSGIIKKLEPHGIITIKDMKQLSSDGVKKC
jgi:hypothetical protein